MGKIKILLLFLLILFLAKNVEAAFDFAVYGDSRTGHGFHQAIVDQITVKDPDFVLHTGDFVGSGGQVADWTMFQSIASPLLSKTPPLGLTRSFFPAIGNHDLPIANYFSVFSMSDYYYSFEYEDFHFVVLDAEQSYSVGSIQYNWLSSDLSSVQNKNIIVSLHRPAYSSGAHGSDSGIINNLVPLFERYGVRFVFSGHDHIYERSFPVYQGAVNNRNGVIYIVAGAGGAPLYNITPGNWWTAEAESAYSFVYLQITPTSFTGQTIDRSGNVFDSFEIASTDIENHSISVNSGASVTNSRDVTLSFSASETPFQMIISEDQNFSGSAWETYSTTKHFTLSSGDGTKTVYAKFRDQQYGETSVVNDTIILDTTSPVVSSSNTSANEIGLEGIARDTNIDFTIEDSGSDIAIDTLDISINDIDATAGGSCQDGYSCSMEQVNSYDISINPDNDFQYNQKVTVDVSVNDNQGNTLSTSWIFTVEGSTLSPKILTTSGPGEVTRLQAYSKATTDGSNSLLEEDITGLFPDSYLGGAGIVPIDQNNNDVLDQFLIFARENGGPQARVMGLSSDGSTVLGGQQFVFQNPDDTSGTSSIRDGLSATSGDFDNDGYQDDAAFCLTGDYNPHVKVYTDVSGIDDWNLLNQFTVPNIGATGCNLGTFQYDTEAEELLITSNHGPATPNVYIYTVGGTEKAAFQAYDDPINQGLTATGVGERIYTTPNNGSSHVRAFDSQGEAKNFWWVYEQHVRGDFTIQAAQLDPSDDKQELLISPVGSNGPHILGYRASGVQKSTPNFFAFSDPTLRNGAGVAVIENWHGVN
ncbi:MAG: metallophosphoesterase [Parcubacteria group bacterium]